MKKTLILVALLQVACSLFAQKEKVELKLTLRDGNVITGTSTSLTTISLNTDYGKLDIPIKHISSLEFGIIPDVANKPKIVVLIKQMNDPSLEKRQAAYDELIKLSINTIPVIEAYLYGDEYQASEYNDYTPEAALKEMKNSYGVDSDYASKDVVTIDYQYVIGGVFAVNTINLKTEYGELNIPKEKIKDAQISCFDDQAADKSFKLLASKHIAANEDGGWVNTGIKIKAGQKITIQATGEVELESLSGNKYTPDGNTTEDYETSYDGDYPAYGNLVIKIGESGEVLKAGSTYTETAKSSGVLYLSIFETVYNPSNKGFYNVKVSVK